MSVDYSNLLDLLNKNGYSIGSLISSGVIKDFSGRKIRNGEPIDLKHIDAICQFFRVPIEQVVEIIIEDESGAQSPE